MTEAKRHQELEIDVDLRQQRLEWRLQRTVWVLFAALLGAVVLGLLGGGPLSTSVAETADGALRLEYERFVRRGAADTLGLDMTATGTSLELRLDSRYLRRIQIEKIAPQPRRTIAGEDFVAVVFETRPGERIRASIEYLPAKAGGLTGWIEVPGTSRLVFNQFVHP